jgi:hypothetical protein
MVHSLHYDNRIRYAALSWRKSAFANFVSRIFRVPELIAGGARVISFYALSLKIFYADGFSTGLFPFFAYRQPLSSVKLGPRFDMK